MPTGARDRDAAGRPRNARPRDAAGRPLPYGTPSVEPGLVVEATAPQDAVRQAQRLLDSGHPFHAHEVFETAWKAGDPEYRDMWQGLAQLAVGLTHAQRGNASGAAALLHRGAERLARFAGSVPADLDLTGLHDHALALAGRIESTGLDGITAADLRPALQLAGHP